MSRRRKPPPLPEPVKPLPPNKQQGWGGGSYRPIRRQKDSEEMARWWRQRDQATKRGEKP